MIRYNGVFTAIRESFTASGAGVFIELQVPAGKQIEILRAWVGAAEGADPIADVQEIYIYGNDAAATGGTGMTEQPIRGGDDATTVTALAGPAQGATPTTLYRSAWHLYNEWLYLPVPEERIRVVGGGTIDNVGLGVPVAPDASITVTAGITWGELG
jgi:hypothetical protein